MAKENKKPEEVKEDPKAEEQQKLEKTLVPADLEFVCRMCLSLQGKPGARSSDCIMKNAKGILCSNMQKLSDKIIALETVNEQHDKYLKAFNTEVYYTKEDMHLIYSRLINEKPISEDEFLDYCRNAGFIIV